MKDYLSILADLPAKHSGLLFEQLHRAADAATFHLRQRGLTLPGEASKMPNHASVYEHLRAMANRALDGYYTIQQRAPQGTAANEVWGEDGDRLFSVVVSGLSSDPADGVTAEIDMNLLYGADQ